MLWSPPFTEITTPTLIALKNNSGWYLSAVSGNAMFGSSGNWFNPSMMNEMGCKSLEELLDKLVKSGWADILQCHIRLGSVVL